MHMHRTPHPEPGREADNPRVEMHAFELGLTRLSHLSFVSHNDSIIRKRTLRVFMVHQLFYDATGSHRAILLKPKLTLM